LQKLRTPTFAYILAYGKRRYRPIGLQMLTYGTSDLNQKRLKTRHSTQRRVFRGLGVRIMFP